VSERTVSNEELCEVVGRKLVERRIPFTYAPSGKQGGRFKVDNVQDEELEKVINEDIDWGESPDIRG